MGGRFVGIPHWVLLDESYRAASDRARSLLLDVAMQYSGHNNGKLVVCAKALKPLGWRSADGIQKAKTELLALGLLIETRKGARPNKASWFALGWRPLEVKDGIDITVNSYVTLAMRKNAALIPSCGIGAAKIAPSHGIRRASSIPPHGAIRAKSGGASIPPHGAYLDVAIPSEETEGVGHE